LKFQIVEDESAYLAASRRWVHGEPFPLVRGEITARTLDFEARYLPRLRSTSEPTALSGIVVCASSSEALQSAANIYADATSRDIVITTPLDLPRTLFSVADRDIGLIIAPADLRTLEQWPTTYAPRTGVLVARTLEGLAALLYRALTRSFFPLARPLSVSLRSLAGARNADIVRHTDLRASTGRRHGLFSLRGEGRECCTHLLDAVICGRSSHALGPVSTPGRTRASCEVAGACIRSDIDDSQRILASSITADVIIAESCHAVALGHDNLSSDLSLGLGFMESSAVALFGSTGPTPDHQIAQFVSECLVANQTLGSIVAALNTEYKSPISVQPSHALLGDGGVRLGDQIEGLKPPTTVAIRSARTTPIETNGNRTTSTEEPVTDSVVDNILQRLAATAGRDPGSSDRSAVLSSIMNRNRRAGWELGTALRRFTVQSAAATTCSTCSSMRASLVHVDSSELGAVGTLLMCSRCGPVETCVAPALAGSSLTVTRLDAPGRCEQGSPFTLDLHLKTDYPTLSTVTIGAVLRSPSGLRAGPPWIAEQTPSPEGFVTERMSFVFPIDPSIDQVRLSWIAFDRRTVRAGGHWVWRA